LIITRTPFRISFFGGGTDYPEWYMKHGGAVLATSIDKYCYISCRHLPPFFEHKHRIVYSQIENVSEYNQIEHPSARAVLNWANITEGLEIHHDGDLPARSGLGSSSSFTVGLIHALQGLNGEISNKDSLAKNAIHIEQNIIKENVGSQDQISATFGGLNRIEFHQDGTFDVAPVILRNSRREELISHLMLFFTGFSRIASDIAKSKIENLKNRETELNRMKEMVDEGISILQSTNQSLDTFGQLLDTTWKYKRTLSDRVTTPELDEIYSNAIKVGAIGGKIIGAGGGGFLLLYAKPERHAAIRERLNKLVHVPFKFDTSGSRVVFYQPNGF